MSSKTKIMVLHMKELIYTAIFVGLGILLVILLVCMFNKKDDGEKSKETMKYQAGVYTSSILFNDNILDVEVAVDDNEIKSSSLQNLDESVATMYPLVQPALEELAERMGLCVEEVAAAMESGAEIESLQKTISRGDGKQITLMDRLEEEKDANEEIINQLVVDQLLSRLLPLERKLLELRYFREQTQTQTAKELGITQVQVSRLEKKILEQLRRKLKD